MLENLVLDFVGICCNSDGCPTTFCYSCAEDKYNFQHYAKELTALNAENL